MDFGLSDDQKLLEETVRGFLGERVPIGRVRELRAAPCPNDRALWKGLAELGVTGVLVPEEHGGSGLSLLDAAIVSQALGHAVTPAPFLSSSVLVPIALRSVDAPEGGAWLAGIATGELVFAAALTETFSIREGAGVALERGRLSGKALMALDAVGADHVLIAIGADRLAVVDGSASGLTTTRLATIDATRCTRCSTGCRPACWSPGRRCRSAATPAASRSRRTRSARRSR